MDDVPLKTTVPLLWVNVAPALLVRLPVNVKVVLGELKIPLFKRAFIAIVLIPEVQVPELTVRVPIPVIAAFKVAVPLKLLVTLFNEPSNSMPVVKLLVVPLL